MVSVSYQLTGMVLAVPFALVERLLAIHLSLRSCTVQSLGFSREEAVSSVFFASPGAGFVQKLHRPYPGVLEKSAPSSFRLIVGIAQLLALLFLPLCFGIGVHVVSKTEGSPSSAH